MKERAPPAAYYFLFVNYLSKKFEQRINTISERLLFKEYIIISV